MLHARVVNRTKHKSNRANSLLGPIRTFRWQKVGIMSSIDGLVKCTAAQFCEWKQGLKSKGEIGEVPLDERLTSSHIRKREAEEGDVEIPVLGFSSAGGSWLPEVLQGQKWGHTNLVWIHVVQRQPENNCSISMYIMAYGGFLKWGYPCSSSLSIGFSIVNHTPIYGKLHVLAYDVVQSAPEPQ